jgi:hypothetical protein
MAGEGLARLVWHFEENSGWPRFQNLHLKSARPMTWKSFQSFLKWQSSRARPWSGSLKKQSSWALARFIRSSQPTPWFKQDEKALRSFAIVGRKLPIKL